MNNALEALRIGFEASLKVLTGNEFVINATEELYKKLKELEAKN